jgi:hypothetical protein
LPARHDITRSRHGPRPAADFAAMR